MVRGAQIADQQRYWTGAQGEVATERDCVIGLPSVVDAAFGCAHRLIRKSRQPQNACKECPRPLINLEANGVRCSV
jgi:hypothetical protein